MPIEHLVRKIRPREVPGLKVGYFGSVPSDPHYPRGRGPAEGCIWMEGGFSCSGSAVVNPLLEVSEQTVNLNCEP